MRAGGAGGPRRSAASPSARSSAAHWHGPIMRTRATVTRMAATVTRRTTGMVRPTTAIAIRRTTATETGIISATTPDVTDERLPAPITEHGRGKPRALLFCASLRPQLLTGIRLQFAPFYNSYFSLTTTRRHAINFPSSLIEGRLRRHPEGGARSGVLRRRLVTAGLGRPGTPPARHYDLAARSSLHGSEGNCPPL